jgi:hypothetical protein
MSVEYPNIDCPDHPGIIEPGYLICDHLKSFHDIAYVESASPERLGIMVCDLCWKMENDPKYCNEHMYISCAQGLREKGWLVEA